MENKPSESKPSENNPFRVLIPLLLIGVPAALWVSADWSTMFDKPAGAPAAAIPGSPGATADSAAAPGSPAASLVPTGAPVPDKGAAVPPTPADRSDRPAFQDLAEVLRFDVTAAWILGRWPWVSAGLAQLDLQGYRVPVLTGAGEDDVAGALTYYFNARQQVQRITFYGTTGDPDKLIRLLAARFHFGRHLTNNPGLFRYEVAEPKGPAQSYLEIRLVRPSEPAQRFDVSLVIERPEG
jgi:hypothetical protein